MRRRGGDKGSSSNSHHIPHTPHTPHSAPFLPLTPPPAPLLTPLLSSSSSFLPQPQQQAEILTLAPCQLITQRSTMMLIALTPFLTLTFLYPLGTLASSLPLPLLYPSPTPTTG